MKIAIDLDNLRKAGLLLGVFLLTACSTSKQPVEGSSHTKESLSKEAADLERRGFRTLVGRLPLEEQLSEARHYQRAKDEQGNLIYFVSISQAWGNNFNVARLQAESQAKVDLAGQIETQVGQLISNQMESSGQYTDDAHQRTVGSSKTLVKSRLTHIVPLLEIYRDDPDGRVEVQVAIGYPRRIADEIVNQLTTPSE